jgi:hypothetical protein
MKKTIIFIILLWFSIMTVIAQTKTQKENSIIDELFKSHLVVNKEKIVSDTLEKVFDCSFYKVDAGFDFEGGSLCTNNLFIIKDGKLLDYDDRLDSLFNLLKVLRSDFRIKNETDVKIFETALDKLFPISWPDDEKKEHIKKGNKWYFIRGDFFDSKSGYIVTLDPSMKITNIAYDMKAITQDK